MPQPKNVFVLGLDQVNLETLEALPGADDLRFHTLLEPDQLIELEQLDLPARLADAERSLRDFDGTVDAVVGYWDFPVSSLVPILCRRFGLSGPRLEGVLACEHKYWSRLQQAKAIDDHPAFGLVRLDDDPKPPDDVPFPMWLKPVKSTSSQLAFKAEDEEGFRRAVVSIRHEIDAISRPFDLVLEHADLPPEIEEIGGRACLAEEAATGRQFTVEGYCLDDEPRVYGVVETVLYPGRSNFLRYEYPAPLPADVDDRMVRASERVMRRMGIGSGTFNIEYFWDEETDRIRLLEVNPRLSQAHAQIFEQVDGAANHQAMVAIGLGHDPQIPHRQGKYDVAAKFFPRVFQDGVVTKAPGPDDVTRVQQHLPGVVGVTSAVTEGTRLSELPHQDPYSYALADIVIGAEDTEQLVARYEAALDALGFVIEEAGEEEAGRA